MEITEIEEAYALLLRNIRPYCSVINGLKLRKYQLAAATAIIDSIRYEYGDTIVVMFPRQSGKNELQAQLQSFLLASFSYSKSVAEMVQVSPTWKPQTQNAMRRLERVCFKSRILKNRFRREAGYIFRFEGSRVIFLSGAPSSSVVGATASKLLSCDEAQDIGISKWDKDFAPMAASRNATRVFWGTAWTSKTLLARELRAAEAAQKKDGRRRVFRITANDVRKEVKAYGRFADAQIAKLGRGHPLVKTQFFSEEIDGEGGLFDEKRRYLMQGSHPGQHAPLPGHSYAFLLDVAGEDELVEEGQLANKGRDSTALTIVDIDFSTLADELIRAPRYLVVERREWVGVKHTAIYGQLTGLVDQWQPRYLVCDSTGVGAGLTSFLDKRYPGLVIPYVFTQKSKSDLGWQFLAVIETGRFKEYVGETQDIASVQFWKQAEACQHELMPGVGKMMRWGVPDGTRDPETGELVHDDLLISAALCAALDAQELGLGLSEVGESVDLFGWMEDAF